MYCALTFFGSLSKIAAVPFENRSLILSFLKDSLHHLILVGCDEPGQTAGQQHANQLGECNPKSHSSDDSHVGLHETGHQIITTLKTETQSQRHVLSRPNGPGLSYHTHTYTPIFISQIQ